MKGKKKSTDPRVEALEAKFQKAQEQGDTDTIYICIWNCVENILKGLIVGHKVNSDIFEERVNEAQVLMCNWYHNKITKDPDFKIRNLVNALYIQTVFDYRSKKHEWEDKHLFNKTDLIDEENLDVDLYDRLAYQEWQAKGE